MIPASDAFHANLSPVCHNQKVEHFHLSLTLNRNSSLSFIRNSVEAMNLSLISTLDSY